MGDSVMPQNVLRALICKAVRTVIPAKAGIQNACKRLLSDSTNLDSRFRGNDD